MNDQTVNQQSIEWPEFSRNQSGMTLIEVICAMVIFLIVTGSIYSLLEVGRRNRDRVSTRSDVSKNARAALNLIGRDLFNAGYKFNRGGVTVPDNFFETLFKFPADSDTKRDELTSIVPGDNIYINDMLPAGKKTDTVILALRAAEEFNNGDHLNMLEGGAAPSTDTLRLRIKTGNNSRNRIWDLYLVEDGAVAAAVMATNVPSGSAFIDFAPGDPLGINQAVNSPDPLTASVLRKCDSEASPPINEYCINYQNVTLKKFYLVSYRVTADGTLLRTTYGNNSEKSASEQIQESPLAFGIEDLQFRFTLSDGTITDNPAIGPDGINGTADDGFINNNKIRQVTVTVTVRGKELDRQTHEPIKIVTTSTFSTRNLEYKN